MAKDTLTIVQGSSTLWDFQSTTNVISAWKLATHDRSKLFVEDTMTLNPTGANRTAFLDNINTLGRTILTGEDNYEQFRSGYPYTPTFIQFKQDGQSNTLQSEFFGGNPQEVENYLSGALRANVLPNLSTLIRRRPYWEETTAQSLATSQSVSNDGGYVSISGIRGDLPSPLAITVRTATTNQDRVIIGCKARGTVANFVNKYEAEGYTTRYTTGASVADLSSATEPNFSPGSGTVGQRWTVDTTSEITLLTWDITSNVSDQLGSYRVFVRCRDNNSTFNVAIRARAGVYTGSSAKQYGEYGDIRRYGDGTGTSGGSNSSPGTTSVPLIDCGIISLPPVDTQGSAPSKMIIELAAKAAAASSTFDVDYLLLVPLYELPFQNGFTYADFPIALGNGAAPDAIVTAQDRTPRAYLDSSGTLQYGASEIRGNPLFAKNNTTIRIYVMTQRVSNLRHTYNLTNTISVTAMPRYRYPGRGT